MFSPNESYICFVKIVAKMEIQSCKCLSPLNTAKVKYTPWASIGSLFYTCSIHILNNDDYTTTWEISAIWLA